MRAAQIAKPGGEFEVVEREIPKPGAGKVLIKVQACGVCHSDVFVKEALWPEFSIRGFPGTNVVGVIEELGTGVTSWTKGQRVWAGTTAAGQYMPRVPAWTLSLLPESSICRL
jgi:D-arabinose 1-dehydrogenase-like Zn-dependent alcohol dehydrogenase